VRWAEKVVGIYPMLKDETNKISDNTIGHSLGCSFCRSTKAGITKPYIEISFMFFHII
jgi:hypothetical protein